MNTERIKDIDLQGGAREDLEKTEGEADGVEKDIETRLDKLRKQNSLVFRLDHRVQVLLEKALAS